jgi:DHA1 family bicyclomycin/chloramphenicol resistance-like MFS transporter
MNEVTKTQAGPRVRQDILGDRGLVLLIAVLSAFVPLSTDLYLPALPGMSEYFNVPTALTNLTLILFFVFFSLSMLFWGPLSDKYGRRPVLITGLSLYIVASVACAAAWTLELLVLFRVLQAIGGSAGTAVATAMVKDVYEGRKRESVLALVQSMVVISPAVAPVLGAFMLPFTSWRGIFLVLAFIGIVSLIGSLALRETIPDRYMGSMGQSLRLLGTVLKNPGFASLLVVFSLVSTASLAFIADSSYIYEDGFGLSEQWYSFYFAINAVALIAGPALYVWLSRFVRRNIIIVSGFSFLVIGGTLVSLFGHIGPLAFALALLPASLMSACVRPAGVFLMLGQQQGNAGAASALINCFGLLFGSAGMVLVSVGGTDLIRIIGAINIAVGLVCLAGWTLISRLNLARDLPDSTVTVQGGGGGH